MGIVNDTLALIRSSKKQVAGSNAVQNRFYNGNLSVFFKNYPTEQVEKDEISLNASIDSPDKVVPMVVYGEVFLQHQVINRGISASEIDKHPVDEFMLYWGEGFNEGIPGETNEELLANLYINGLPVYDKAAGAYNFKDTFVAEKPANTEITDWDEMPKKAYVGGYNPETGDEIDPEIVFELADMHEAEDSDILTYCSKDKKWRPGNIVGMKITNLEAIGSAIGESGDGVHLNVKKLNLPQGKLYFNQAASTHTVLFPQLTDVEEGMSITTDSFNSPAPGLVGHTANYTGIKNIDFIGVTGSKSDDLLVINALNVLNGFKVKGQNGVTVVKEVSANTIIWRVG